MPNITLAFYVCSSNFQHEKRVYSYTTVIWYEIQGKTAETVIKKMPPPNNAQLFSRVWFFETPGTAACQAPLSMRFSWQEYWSGLPFPRPGDLSNPRIEPASSTLQVGFFTAKPPGKPIKRTGRASRIARNHNQSTSFSFLNVVGQRNAININISGFQQCIK